MDEVFGRSNGRPDRAEPGDRYYETAGAPGPLPSIGENRPLPGQSSPARLGHRPDKLELSGVSCRGPRPAPCPGRAPRRTRARMPEPCAARPERPLRSTIGTVPGVGMVTNSETEREAVSRYPCSPAALGSGLTWRAGSARLSGAKCERLPADQRDDASVSSAITTLSKWGSEGEGLGPARIEARPDTFAPTRGDHQNPA